MILSDVSTVAERWCNIMTDGHLDKLAADLQIAWEKYSESFGESPHGTYKQLRAMLCFLPKSARITTIPLVKGMDIPMPDGAAIPPPKRRTLS